ncbi:hypothetical protein Droror1_Dr00027145 [Drosera rotundifolia]
MIIPPSKTAFAPRPQAPEGGGSTGGSLGIRFDGKNSGANGGAGGDATGDGAEAVGDRCGLVVDEVGLEVREAAEDNNKGEEAATTGAFPVGVGAVDVVGCEVGGSSGAKGMADCATEVAARDIKMVMAKNAHGRAIVELVMDAGSRRESDSDGMYCRGRWGICR